MVAYHLHAKLISRANGRSATGAAAYRAAATIKDERTGTVHDYRRKRYVEHTEILAPPDAPTWALDRSALWNAVEQHEKRKDAQLCREVEVMLPRELSREACIALVKDFAKQQFVTRGMVADIAWHRPIASDGQAHPHAHILLTLRPLTADGFGGKKVPVVNPATGESVRDKRSKIVYRLWAGDVDDLMSWREAWAKQVNAALEDSGSDARVDHRTLDAQREEAIANGDFERAASLRREPEPALCISRWVKKAQDHIRERVNQWTAIRFRNAVRTHMHRLQAEEPHTLADFMEKVRAQGHRLFPEFLADGPSRRIRGHER